MRTIVSIILLAIVALGIGVCLLEVPFGVPKTEVGDYYIENGRDQTGAANIVTAVVVGYRAFDTLGEITVLFVAALGLGAVLAAAGGGTRRREIEPASLVLLTGSKLLFPLIMLFGAYVFIHGHLTPGGGFQGGAIVASAFLLVYLGSQGRRINKVWNTVTESLSGLVFVVIGLFGLTVGGRCFLSNFMPTGALNTLFSAGIIPIIYVAVGFKVGSELAGVIDNLVEETQ
jgi:multicomponent Na+:H+ antiporter subunit B